MLSLNSYRGYSEPLFMGQPPTIGTGSHFYSVYSRLAPSVALKPATNPNVTPFVRLNEQRSQIWGSPFTLKVHLKENRTADISTTLCSASMKRRDRFRLKILII